MSVCFDPSLLSKIPDFVVCTPAQARKARPLAVIIDLIDEHAISPDFDCRAISPISECSQSTDDTSRSRSSTIVGFGRKRHSVLPTCSDEFPGSTVVGFGRKRHHTIAVAPSSPINPDLTQENRKSLPNPVILKGIPVPTDFKRKPDPGSTQTPVVAERRLAGVIGTARKVSGKILRAASRQPPKPFLLPNTARNSFPGRVKRYFVGQLTSVSSSRLFKFVFGRASLVDEPRLKPNENPQSVIERFKNLLRRLRDLIRG
ncbi:hypothetical protein C8R44DRAFT_867799 [Mycena epipterygia]|nr:hypothetical protein C8R44DRAFT_867799 [Mycena epipterygia]